jgi:hypothetical protein
MGATLTFRCIYNSLENIVENELSALRARGLGEFIKVQPLGSELCGARLNDAESLVKMRGAMRGNARPCPRGACGLPKLFPRKPREDPLIGFLLTPSLIENGRVSRPLLWLRPRRIRQAFRR